MPDLVLTDLTVEYTSGDSTIRVLDALDLEIRSGSTALLLGPSGSGKTTLLSCLAAILTPTSGTIRFGDTVISDLDGGARLRFRRSGVGIVFQAFNLVPSLTALDNVMAPMLAARVPTTEARRRASELLEQVGLGDRMQHRPGRLSGGQQQRVAVARALVNDPPLVLADEPTAHLDQVQVDAIAALFRSLAAPDRIMVIATHDPRLMPLTDQLVDLGAAIGIPHQRRVDG